MVISTFFVECRTPLINKQIQIYFLTKSPSALLSDIYSRHWRYILFHRVAAVPRPIRSYRTHTRTNFSTEFMAKDTETKRKRAIRHILYVPTVYV